MPATAIVSGASFVPAVNGNYPATGSQRNGKDIFKHESQNYWIFYRDDSGDMMYGGGFLWVLTDQDPTSAQPPAFFDWYYGSDTALPWDDTSWDSGPGGPPDGPLTLDGSAVVGVYLVSGATPGAADGRYHLVDNTGEDDWKQDDVARYIYKQGGNWRRGPTQGGAGDYEATGPADTTTPDDGAWSDGSTVAESAVVRQTVYVEYTTDPDASGKYTVVGYVKDGNLYYDGPNGFIMGRDPGTPDWHIETEDGTEGAGDVAPDHTNGSTSELLPMSGWSDGIVVRDPYLSNPDKIAIYWSGSAATWPNAAGADHANRMVVRSSDNLYIGVQDSPGGAITLEATLDPTIGSANHTWTYVAMSHNDPDEDQGTYVMTTGDGTTPVAAAIVYYRAPGETTWQMVAAASTYQSNGSYQGTSCAISTDLRWFFAIQTGDPNPANNFLVVLENHPTLGWRQPQIISASGSGVNQFSTVACDGTYLFVGASNQGVAAYHLNGGAWASLGNVLAATGSEKEAEVQIAYSDPWLFIPAHNAGKIYIYKRSGDGAGATFGLHQTITMVGMLAGLNLTGPIQAYNADNILFAATNPGDGKGQVGLLTYNANGDAWQVAEVIATATNTEGDAYSVLPINGRVGLGTRPNNNHPFRVFDYTPALPPGPDVEVYGNSTAIADGDTTPATGDHTSAGNVQIGGSPVTRTFYIRNIGVSDLQLTGPTPVTLTAGDTGDFTIVTQPSLDPIAVGEGNQVSFPVRFAPTDRGARQATVSIASDDATSPYTFAVGGTGQSALTVLKGNNQTITNGDVIPDPADHTDFGTATAGQTTVERTFTVQNTGEYDLLVTNVALSVGVNFSISEEIGLSTIPAGQSTTFKVLFNPVQSGDLTDTVTVTSNGFGTTSYTFAIGGTGVAPEITLTGPSIDVEVNKGDAPAPTVLNVENTGDATLNLRVSKGAATWLTVTPSSSVLTPSGDVDLTVTIATAGLAEGDYEAVLTFSDANGATAEVTRVIALSVMATVRPGKLAGANVVVRESDSPRVPESAGPGKYRTR